MTNKGRSARSPTCGDADARNEEYLENFTTEKFFKKIVDSKSPIIFDIGAHRGESIIFFRDIYPSAEIYCFEPDPQNFEALEEIASKNMAKAYNFAVSQKDGRSTFYTQDISHLGSLVPINRTSRDSLGYAKKAKNEKFDVETVTLDSFCTKHKVDFIDIIKIDVQGAEKYVLKGAKSAIKKCKCVIIEISLYDFYDNDESSLLVIEKIMNSLDFEIWDVSKISKNPKNFRTDWLEVVYVSREIIGRS